MDLSTDTLVDAAPAAAFAALVGALASEPVLNALARKLADRLPQPEAEQAEGFLSVDEAARYLACKPQRIYDSGRRVACGAARTAAAC